MELVDSIECEHCETEYIKRNRHKCNICRQIFWLEHNFIRHRRVKHGKIRKTLDPYLIFLRKSCACDSECDSGDFVCLACGDNDISFSGLAEAKQHIDDEHHAEKALVCNGNARYIRVAKKRKRQTGLVCPDKYWQNLCDEQYDQDLCISWA
jgi:hypothetical protein